MVTYVALLMLLQLGLAPAEATLCSALLFVPWVLKSFMRPWVSRVGHFRFMLHLIEVLLFVALVLLALSFKPFPIHFSFFNNLPSSLRSGADGTFFTLHSSLFTLLALLLVSLLAAWHELVARMYYERMLRPAFQRLFTVPKLACSQMAVIITYGALIFLVGTLEVYFRQIRYSWAMGCYVAAGIFLLFAFHHLLWLRGARECEAEQSTKDSTQLPGRQEKRHVPFPVTHCIILFLLLLPQALMFHARVLYLFDTHAHGGLQCTMQEIGFAQGTVGVIAFSLGIALGRVLINRYSLQRFFWPMSFCLVLSPFVYLAMTIWPPQSLWHLCCCTMTAQLLFGLGIGVCRLPISKISGNRYRNTISMLQIPLVAAAMVVPMAISGWMVQQMGYNAFFLVNALAAPVCLLGVYLLRPTTSTFFPFSM
jgi:PAT family beta-lactamase induction signal transducer AmpG